MSSKKDDLEVPRPTIVDVSLDFYGFGPRTRPMHFIKGSTISETVNQFCMEHKVPATHRQTLLFLAHDIVQEMYLSFGKSCIEKAERKWKEDRMEKESDSLESHQKHFPSSHSSIPPLYPREYGFETLLDRNITSKKIEEEFLMKWEKIVRDPMDRIRIAALEKYLGAKHRHMKRTKEATILVLREAHVDEMTKIAESGESIDPKETLQRHSRELRGMELRWDTKLAEHEDECREFYQNVVKGSENWVYDPESEYSEFNDMDVEDGCIFEDRKGENTDIHDSKFEMRLKRRVLRFLSKESVATKVWKMLSTIVPRQFLTKKMDEVRAVQSTSDVIETNFDPLSTPKEGDGMDLAGREVLEDIDGDEVEKHDMSESSLHQNESSVLVVAADGAQTRTLTEDENWSEGGESKSSVLATTPEDSKPLRKEEGYVMGTLKWFHASVTSIIAKKILHSKKNEKIENAVSKESFSDWQMVEGEKEEDKEEDVFTVIESTMEYSLWDQLFGTKQVKTLTKNIDIELSKADDDDVIVNPDRKKYLRVRQKVSFYRGSIFDTMNACLYWKELSSDLNEIQPRSAVSDESGKEESQNSIKHVQLLSRICEKNIRVCSVEGYPKIGTVVFIHAEHRHDTIDSLEDSHFHSSELRHISSHPNERKMEHNWYFLKKTCCEQVDFVFDDIESQVTDVLESIVDDDAWKVGDVIITRHSNMPFCQICFIVSLGSSKIEDGMTIAEKIVPTMSWIMEASSELGVGMLNLEIPFHPLLPHPVEFTQSLMGSIEKMHHLKQESKSRERRMRPPVDVNMFLHPQWEDDESDVIKKQCLARID